MTRIRRVFIGFMIFLFAGLPCLGGFAAGRGVFAAAPAQQSPLPDLQKKSSEAGAKEDGEPEKASEGNILGIINYQTLWSMLSLPIAGLLGALIAYHPVRMKVASVQQPEWEVPKALILIALAGGVVGGVVKLEPAMAFAFFGFGSFIRFRTSMKNPKETVVIFLCAGIGCLSGLHRFDLAVAATVFVWIALLILDWGVSSGIERITLVLKGLGDRGQEISTRYKEKLEDAGIEVVSSKVSLKKGNVRIVINKEMHVTTEEIEKYLFSEDDTPRPKSVEWVRE